MNNNISIKSPCFFLLILLLFIAVFCGGCQMSPQERHGVSLLPQNRPSRGGGFTSPYTSMGLSL